MGQLVDYAKNELDIILRGIDKEKDKESYEAQKMVSDQILELVKVFEIQCDSEYSASYKIARLTKLLNFKPITALNGTDDEWNDAYGNVQQNNRCSSVFRENKDNSTAHDIDMHIFSDNGGISWFSGGGIKEELGISDKITFPYFPEERPKAHYVRMKDLSKHTYEDNVEDITDDKEAQKKLSQEYFKNPEAFRW